MSTSFSIKCEILAEVHSESLWNKELDDFKNYNDVGLPLAYLTHTELAKPSTEGIAFIEETWVELCTALGVDSDKEYKNSEELLEEAGIDLFGDRDDL